MAGGAFFGAPLKAGVPVHPAAGAVRRLRPAVALRIQGYTNSEIGQRLNLHPVTVCRIFTAMKKLEAAGVVAQPAKEPPTDIEVLRDWKQRLTKKSIKALDRGLDDATDNYKAGNLGHTVLKGLGEFQGDSVNVNVQAFIASVPPEWRERYFATRDEPPPRQLPPEEHEVWALDVFKKSSCSAEQFNQLRREAREGRMRIVTDDDDFNEFFRAEQALARRG